MTWNLDQSYITTILFVSESLRNHPSKVIKDTPDIESLSVEITENTKIPNAVTKEIKQYRQCALTKVYLSNLVNSQE